jgi:nucleoporin SEH1
MHFVAMEIFPVSVASDSDYVHDVSYNYYGNRMAICTSSQSISIWDLGDAGWKESARINNAHSGPIWRLDWAHPQFGDVIASCSEDRTISIWSCGSKGWKKRATLTDSPYAVTDVQFCDRNFGLKFAACTADGMVRIYEATDPLNLSAWEVEDFSTVDTKGGPNSGCSALSWCAGNERIGVVGASGRLKVFEKKNRWILIAEREASDKSGSPLKDCAWAPNLCRDYDWIATCGDSSTVTVWELRENERSASLIAVHTIDCGVSPIWRCAWSITGDILSVAPESGEVQLWRLAGIGSSCGWEKLENED